MKYFFMTFFSLIVLVIPTKSLLVHAEAVAPVISLSTSIKYYDKNLSKGMCDQKIQDLQQYLSDKGYVPKDPSYNKYITGYFGPATFKAVKKMQADNSIPSTGIVGPKTRVFLDGEYNKAMVAYEARRQEEIKNNPDYRATGALRAAKCIYDKIPVASFSN